MKITKMTVKDYDEVFALWKKTEGVGLHKDMDSRKGIAKYLRRNRGLSVVARENKKIIGAILCGNDGRRGHLYHLAVDQAYRKKGLGKALVNRALLNLAALGFTRCTIGVFAKNYSGRKFWKHIGWIERPDVIMMAIKIRKIKRPKK